MQHDGSAVCKEAPHTPAARSNSFDSAWTKSFWHQPYIRMMLTAYVYSARYTANMAPCWHYSDDGYNSHSYIYTIYDGVHIYIYKMQRALRARCGCNLLRVKRQTLRVFVTRNPSVLLTSGRPVAVGI